MVSFVLGIASSGKTYNLISRIGELSNSGENEILFLVPEQASFECEKELLKTLGVKTANRVKVLSFTRLCSTVLSDVGGLGARVADDGTRLILLLEALESLKDNLSVYGKFSGVGFAQKLIKDLSELKQAALTPEKLKECAAKVENKSLALKLSDIAEIMSAYDSLLGQKFVDPEDVITVTARRVAQENWFKGKHIFIDGFTGFTRSQYQLLECAIRSAESVVFSFTTDNDIFSTDTELFANIKKEISYIKAIAQKYAVKVDKPLILTDSKAKCGELTDLEALLRGKKISYTEPPENIKLCPCMSPRDEVEFVANEICRQVRKQGRRWRDFVIIAGNGANLDKTVASVMKKYEIPCFVSANKLLCDLPIARFVTSALSAIKGGYKTEDILAYLKSGLADLSDDEINTLENYVYLWDISGKKWLSDWDMNPFGVEENSASEDEIKAILTEINGIRNKAVKPLRELESTMQASATDMVRSVYNFLVSCKTAQKLKEYTNVLESQGEYAAASLQSTSWDKLISVLDRITNSISSSKLSLQRFSEILATSFAAETVGEIPQRTDEVIFGTADRLRPLRPAVVFVMSANIGVFPAGISNSGIFTLSERNEMQRADAPLPDRYLAAVTEQNYLFYTALCCASERVYITYSRISAKAELKPSAEVTKIRKAFGFAEEKAAKVYSFNTDNAANFERPNPAFSYLSMNMGSTDGTLVSLREALAQTQGYSNKLKLIERAKEKSDIISPEVAGKLYGDRLYLSASRLETFYSCPFSYFCRYGLKATPKRKANLDSRVRGTVAHYVFEKVLEKYNGNFAALDSKTAYDEASKTVDEYFTIKGIDINTLDAASRYAVSCISELICEVLTFVAKDFTNNEFEPAAFELGIGNNEKIPPLTVKAENSVVNISGKIDRVDSCKTEDGTAVRIVDYKSGTKAFNLAHVLEGRNMQMLIYLCAVVESNVQLFDSPKPAGILYVQALPSAKQEEFSVKPSAFLIDDAETLSKMDKDLQGEFIPVKTTKSGGIDRRSPVVSMEDFQIIFKYVKSKIANMANEIRKGNISIDPLEVGNKSGCDYCEFRNVCGKEVNDTVRTSEFEKYSNGDVISIMKEEVSN